MKTIYYVVRNLARKFLCFWGVFIFYFSWLLGISYFLTAVSFPNVESWKHFSPPGAVLLGCAAIASWIIIFTVLCIVLFDKESGYFNAKDKKEWLREPLRDLRKFYNWYKSCETEEIEHLKSLQKRKPKFKTSEEIYTEIDRLREELEKLEKTGEKEPSNT